MAVFRLQGQTLGTSRFSCSVYELSLQPDWMDVTWVGDPKPDSTPESARGTTHSIQHLLQTSFSSTFPTISRIYSS